jgi:uncharacterized membrane protein
MGCGGERVTTPIWHVRKENVHRGSSRDRNPAFASFDVVLRQDHEAEVERLTEALETVIRENAAGYDNLKRRLERLTEERDRLVEAVTHVLRHGHVGKQSERRLREALSSLPVREDGQ